MATLTNLYTGIGGKLMHSEDTLRQKLQNIRAFVFDWDGVFTTGWKNHDMQSGFNEVDSMGTNMLRFSYHILHKQLPVTAIISGEKNQAAFRFAKREFFHASYAKAANKLDAIAHLCDTHHLQPNQVAFMFDDVLDLSLAEVAGFRVFIPRPNNPLFNRFVESHNLADYITAGTSGGYAIREACELIMALQGSYDDVIRQRMAYADAYHRYLEERRAVATRFYTFEQGKITETGEDA